MRSLGLALCAVFGLSACSFGKVEGTKLVTLDIHIQSESLPTVKEALQNRLVLASTLGDLPLKGARANEREGALHFELDARLNATCTPQAAEITLRYATHLLTQSGRLELLRVAPKQAEAIAKALRERQLSAQTPYEKPGMVVTQASENELKALVEAQGEGKLRVLTALPGEHWIAEVEPVLRGTDLSRTRWEQNATTSHVELVMKEDKVTHFWKLTEDARGQPLLVLLNGRLLAAPMVGARITNGRWVFEVPGEPSMMRADLESIAATNVEQALKVTHSEVRCGARPTLGQ